MSTIQQVDAPRYAVLCGLGVIVSLLAACSNESSESSESPEASAPVVAEQSVVADGIDGGTIYGTVSATEGRVVGFLVKAKLPVANMTWNVFTRDGEFRVPNLTPGRYEVQVAQRGFESPVETVDVSANEAVRVDIQVAPAPGFDVSEQFRPRDSHTGRVRPDAELVEFDELYPPGPGRDALMNHCFNCHGTGLHHMRKDRAGWEWTMRYMTDKHSFGEDVPRGNIIYTKANFPEKDIELIVDYLSENFGPDDPYRDLRLEEFVPDEDVIADAIYIEYDVPPQPGYVPRSYHDPHIGPNGEVWANDKANRAIVQIDPEARDADKMIVREFQAPDEWNAMRMHGIETDSEGNVYNSDTAGGFLTFTDIETGEWTHYGTTGDYHESIVQIYADRDDNIWGGLISGNKLMKFDTAAREMHLWDLPTPDSNPYGLIVASDGKIWTAAISKHRLVRFDPETETFDEFLTPTQPSAPRRLGEDRDGNIWWAEYVGGNLGMLDPDSGEMRSYPFPLAYSRGYDAWPVGDYVWVTESTYEALIRFDPRTGQFVYYPLPLNQPSGNPGVPKMEIGHDGVIWFTYRGRRNAVNPIVAFLPKGNAREAGDQLSGDMQW